MPVETQEAVNWALQQNVDGPFGPMQVTKDTPDELVGKVREYFNANTITYSTFSYDDLLPFLN